jgi:peptidoglycan/xylan/chitin deacetylase (PgdA/CDA1 family)
MKTLIFAAAMLFAANLYSAEAVRGITSSIEAESGEKTLYLTLDACGGPKSSGFDAALLSFLEENNIPATLFLSGKWIDKNPDITAALAKNCLFKIGNHGTNHKPACLNGMEVYGIKGTRSKEELLYEIENNAAKIEKFTGAKPLWFRSGTAYYDREAIDIITDELNLNIAGFSISADEGASLPPERVFDNMMKAKPGFIIIAHMNHPESGTADGVKRGIEELAKEGYTFRLLPDIKRQKQ